MAEQILSLARDDGERIVDLVARSGGELGQGGQLAGLQALALAMYLVFQGAMQRVDLLFQMIVHRLLAEPAVLGR